MRALIALSLFTVGCYQPLNRIRVDEARIAVWSAYEEYGAPPDVLFIDQSELNCNRGTMTGRMYGYFAADALGSVADSGECVTGQMFLTKHTAQLAVADGWNYSDLSLAHEFWHAHVDALTGDPDYAHTDPGFGERYGHPRGAVDLANDDLVRLGL